jgi:hypothetical protein
MARGAGCLRESRRACVAVLAVAGLFLGGPAASQSESGTAASPSEGPGETLSQPSRPIPTDEPEIRRMRIQWRFNQAFDTYSEALANNVPTFLYFSARPCGFCLTMFEEFRCPAVVRYAGFMEFGVSYRGEDDGGDHLAAALNIQRFPTAIILETDLDKLHVIGRIEGVFHADEIDDVIQEAFRAAAESGEMKMPDLRSVEETRTMLDQADIARPSEAFCAGEED